MNPHENTEEGPPHVLGEPKLRRRGGFFLADDWDAESGRPVGPAWVQWEAPADEADWRIPVVFVHGGGGQSTDWMWAVDGQPGWAELFVRAGHPSYLLDRPGHGRSVRDPRTMGERGPVPDATLLSSLFQTDEKELRTDTGGRFGPVAASSSGLAADPESTQRMDLARLTHLLEKTGPAIVVSHSAGAPCVWSAASCRPDLVRLVVAVEPLGPPFGGQRHPRALREGVTALPLGGSLARVPVVMVTASSSGHQEADRETAAFLRGLGGDVEHLLLEQHGLTGDGHGVVFDRNSSAAFHLVHQRCLPIRA